jgi:TonB-dependent receptor
MSHRQVKRMRRAVRTAFVTAVSLDLLAIAMPSHAQDAEPPVATDLEEIIVRGVRGAQEAAINIKRNSAEVVDSIVSEDIGKLPDVTITDALQRVTGVQISRAAGEGSLVSIRGAQQVMATMNGERFITAQNLLDSNTDFQDVPTSQISGVNVYKSQNAALTDGGLGGVIDLQSARALKMKDGLTLTSSAQGSWGSIVDGTDKKYEGFVGYKWNDRIGMSLAASYNDSISASSFQSTEFDLADEFSTWINGGVASGDINGDGNTTEEFVVPIGWNTFVNSRQFDRQRLGLAYNFNAEVSDSVELIADVFYNNMDEHQNGQQLFVNGNFGGRQIFYPYTAATGDPSVVDSFPTDGLISRANVATDITGYTNGLRGGVQSTFRDTDALNTNLELRFGKGEKFSGSLRWVHADADRTSRALTVAQQTDAAALDDPQVDRLNPWLDPTNHALGRADPTNQISLTCLPRNQADVDNGTCTQVNTSAIPTSLVYPISESLGASQLNYVIGDQLRTLAGNPAAWRLHSSWLERNHETAKMDVLRADGKFEITDEFSFDFGLRFSKRNNDEVRDDYFSPSGIDGLLAKYEEVGYAVRQRANTANRDFDPLPIYTLANPALGSNVTTVTDFGVNGLQTAFPFINTETLEHPEAWRDGLYGEGQYVAAPDRTYGIDERQSSLYFKTNFNAPLSDNVKMSGNIGVRVVKTRVTVFQNVTDSRQLNPDILAGGDPNHSAYTDLGDLFTTTDRTRALPSFNLNFDFHDDWRLKLAYYETQALQPLENLGRGEITFYNGEQIGEPFQRVSSIQRLGNPRLEPWLSRSFSSAIEWYPRENSLATFGLFYTDVDSYTYQRTGTDPTAPDSDGVVRNGANTLDIAQGEGASYYGFELGYQASFDFLPGFLKYTGTTVNYTFTPSQAGKDAATGQTIKLADGSDAPFNNTAENQVNLILWYENSRFQARVAANYLSKQYQGAFTHWSFSAPNAGLANYQEATMYVDASASFDVNEHFQVYVQGSNLTEEAPVNYIQWQQNRNNWNQYERVLSLGVKAKF